MTAINPDGRAVKDDFAANLRPTHRYLWQLGSDLSAPLPARE